jgi:hypothetical protein
MVVHFESVRQINLSADGSRAGIDIYFERVDHPPPQDPTLERMRSDYEVTMTVLKEMELPDKPFFDLVNELIVGAQIGLVGEAYSPESGRTQLNIVRRKLVHLARQKRDSYLWTLAKVSGIVAAVFAVLTLVVSVIDPESLPKGPLLNHYKEYASWLIPFCLLHPGVALGVVFTAFSLNRVMTFERINQLDPYYFSPWMRLFYTSVVAYVLLAALWFKVIMLGAGGFLLNDIRTDPAAGVVIGLVCGVSEAIVVQMLLSRLEPSDKKAGSHV